ncbi:S8 family peptidase [Fulvivirga sediminis]|uniref:S8/S53 family peptidase n=1 Tax=Fulvivirga sediminis TaxID=2803949 RepID=A0A937JYR2_9BACT|nr:S8/S53 family peptidase [Fulvivirga sediminis]MBL3655929.1 S8/S53 family peptidase [Fulvivirga sediminis]
MNLTIKTHPLLLLLGTLILWSCNDSMIAEPDHNMVVDPVSKMSFPNILVEENSKEALSIREINRIIPALATEESPWRNVSDHTLWSAVLAGDGAVTIGIEAVESLAAEAAVAGMDELTYAKEYTKAYLNYINDDKSSISFESYDGFPMIWATITDYGMLAKLRQLPTVRYIEPDGFDLEANEMINGRQASSGSGCADDENYANQADRYTIPAGTNYKVSWHLYTHNIPAAWSYAEGEDIMIGVVDTGIGENQNQLRANFGSGRTVKLSRTTEALFKKNRHPYDDCGHGTSMSGQMTAPRNSIGAMVGIAPRADLHSVKIANGVIIETTKERKAFVKAVKKLADDPDVRVINISVGRLNGRDDMKDALDYADSKGKLIVCAAGSVLGLKIFPASYSKTIAATGVVYDPQSDPNGINLEVINSDGVHNAKGDHVDFAVYLKRKSDGDYALGLNRTNANSKKALGSSAASATVSGIAALIWSANPDLTKAQVVNIMRNSGSYKRFSSGPSNNYGYGIIDAEQAVIAAANY